MRIWIGGLFALVAVAHAGAAWADDLRAFNRPEVERAIARLTQQAIWAHTAGRPTPTETLPATLRRPAGVFVTISRQGITRGCWGTVRPRTDDLAREVSTNAVKALSLDYRQRPITAAELPGLVAHVSIVGDLEPIGGPEALQPRRFGLLVSGGGKGGVLLPGEAATARWAVETCRRKAGLKPRERASLYRFETAVVGPIPLTPPKP